MDKTITCKFCTHSFMIVSCPRCQRLSTHCPFCGNLIQENNEQTKETAREGGTGSGRPGN